MVGPNKWQRKDPLEANPWQLPPDIGMKKSAAYVAQGVWATVVLVAYALHASADYSYAGSWLLGACVF